MGVIGIGPFVLGHPDLEAARRSMVDAAVTYDGTHAGATLGPGPWPAGYSHDRRVRAVGSGPGAFERAVAAVRHWATHAGAGFGIHPSGPATEGDTVVQRIPLGPVSVLAALRVVRVVEEERRVGIALGTLPLHPEEGEEAFVVSLDDDVVRFRVLAFSRPAHVLARLGAPVTRHLQHEAHGDYLRGVEEAVGSER